MRVCRTPTEMHEACAAVTRGGYTLGLVPTMGALHAGHMSLVSAAKSSCDAVAVSIFVNPAQFGPNEDFAAYPRTFEEDLHQLEAAGIDLLFAPSADVMYPPGNTTTVDPGEIGSRLDGASRPGHFRGVATIVTRLFHIVQPDRAFFGQKDAAQIAVLRHIVRDLNLPVELVVCPTVREPDGLAMSSRNRYLTSSERECALILQRALNSAAELARTRSVTGQSLRDELHFFFPPDPEIRLDYAEVVDPDTLLPVIDISSGALLAIAAWIGNTRLLDNQLLPSITRS